MNIGENLAKLRKNANLNQEKLASLVGVSPKTISSWENNRNLPSIDMLLLLAQILNVKLDDIILDKSNAFKEYKKKSRKKIAIVFLVFIIMSIIFSISSAVDAIDLTKIISSEYSTYYILGYFLYGNIGNFVVYTFFQIVNYFLYVIGRRKYIVCMLFVEIVLIIFSIIELHILYTSVILTISFLTTLFLFFNCKKTF